MSVIASSSSLSSSSIVTKEMDYEIHAIVQDASREVVEAYVVSKGATATSDSQQLLPATAEGEEEEEEEKRDEPSVEDVEETEEAITAPDEEEEAEEKTIPEEEKAIVEEEKQVVQEEEASVPAVVPEKKKKTPREEFTDKMVDEVLTRHFDKLTIPEVMSLALRSKQDIRPKLKSLVEALVDATATSQTLEDKISAIAMLKGLDDDEIPSKDELRQMLRDEVSKKLKELKMQDFRRAENELKNNNDITYCRKNVIDTLVSSRE